MTYMFQLVEIDNSWRVVETSMDNTLGEVFDIFLAERTADGWEVITMCPSSKSKGYVFLLRKHIR